jgi:hypothetical protein
MTNLKYEQQQSEGNCLSFLSKCNTNNMVHIFNYDRNRKSVFKLTKDKLLSQASPLNNSDRFKFNYKARLLNVYSEN